MGNSKELSNILNKKYHFTYQTKNMINGKLYIGRHSTDNLNDEYIGSGKNLKRAILKYGKNNFAIEVLCFFDTLDDLIKEEEFIVDDTWCLNKNTYNIVKGGSNPIMFGESNPSWKGGSSFYIKKGRADVRGNKNPMYGKFHSNITKEKIKNANMGSVPYNKGTKKTIEEKERDIYAQKTRKIISFNGVIYESIRDCARKLNINQGCVQYRVKKNSFPECYIVDNFN